MKIIYLKLIRKYDMDDLYRGRICMNIHTTNFKICNSLEEACTTGCSGERGCIRYFTRFRKVSPNSKDTDGIPVIFNCKDAKTLKRLIDEGADVNILDDNGNTPIEKYRILGKMDCVKVLLKVTETKLDNRNVDCSSPRTIRKHIARV